MIGRIGENTIRTEKLMNQINQRKKEREALVLGN